MPETLPIVIPPRLQERFEIAWQHCRVLFFCAPCGCGRTKTARKLLEHFAVCERSAEERRNVFRQVRLYYELQNQLRPALDCYTKIGEHSKLSALLIKNAQLHLVIALPHWEISEPTELIPAVLQLITSKQIKFYSLSVTSGLPSVMKGGKDLCDWNQPTSTDG